MQYLTEWDHVLQAGEKAVSCGVMNVSSIDELSFIKDLHNRYELVFAK